MSQPPAALLVTDPTELQGVVERAQRAPLVALDTEANGLFVHRARVCVVQLAWREEGVTVVAVIDPLVTSIELLAPLLGPDGPEKVLHDLTFDARILGDAGLPLDRVKDTEVAARLLGRTSLGLAGLLASELGIEMKKGLQRHDWSRRPFDRAQLGYLAADVAHLEDLWSALERAILEKDLAPEIAEETAFKLANARAPEVVRTAWIRIDGARDLDGPGRAILRRLTELRERLAKELDVPPFHVLGPDRLLLLARERPADETLLTAVLRPSARERDRVGLLLEAIRAGLADGDAPAAEVAELRPAPPPREVLARRQRLDRAIVAWRRREAEARGWSEQAVLPGHCARDLAAALARSADAAEAAVAVGQVPALGERRIAWFHDAWVALADQTLSAEP